VSNHLNIFKNIEYNRLNRLEIEWKDELVFSIPISNRKSFCEILSSIADAF